MAAAGCWPASARRDRPIAIDREQHDELREQLVLGEAAGDRLVQEGAGIVPAVARAAIAHSGAKYVAQNSVSDRSVGLRSSSAS